MRSPNRLKHATGRLGTFEISYHAIQSPSLTEATAVACASIGFVDDAGYEAEAAAWCWLRQDAVCPAGLDQ